MTTSTYRAGAFLEAAGRLRIPVAVGSDRPQVLAADDDGVILAAALKVLGLTQGPVQVELRVNERGAWIVEIAPRSIGGLCSRTLRFGGGMSLEALILRHALGLEVESLLREPQAAASRNASARAGARAPVSRPRPAARAGGLLG